MNSFIGGGAERVCLNLAEELHRLNIESDFVTVYSVNADYDIPPYIHIYCIGIRKGSSLLSIFLGLVKSIPKVNAFISNEQYVLVTAHLPVSHILASLTKQSKKCLYVMHVTQHLSDQYWSRGYRFILRNFLHGKEIITVSKGLKKELKDEYQISKDKIEVIYNPCGLIPLKNESAINQSRKRPYILVMGRLEKQKDPELALKLYYEGKFYREYDLVYLGKGSHEELLRRKIREYKLDNYVYLEGFQKEITPWLKNASLLLSCSRQEGLPMNLVEALMCGTPVVAMNCPYGPDEILVDELEKYLLDPGNGVSENIKIIRSALTSYPVITDKYYRKFDGSQIVRRYLKIWNKFTEQNKR